ncbi:MAG: HAMP domain-containing histidine kinase [Planctomycetes bacterium]|nr:HAMP domain-containing histidine kinase [Planctomycetota bacterium]
MALPLSRWTQKRLLYPVAVFAVIVPTVLMALYGTWALREIELRPASYRSDLREVRASTSAALETFIEPLSHIAPPSGAEDATRALADIDTYHSNYTKAITTRAFVGYAGLAYTVRKLDGDDKRLDPAEVVEFFRTLKAREKGEVQRLVINTEGHSSSGLRHECYVAYTNSAGGAIVWELDQAQIDSVVRRAVSGHELRNAALKVSISDERNLEFEPNEPGQQQIAAYASAHPEITPWRVLVLRLDTSAKLVNQETWLSSIFIVIAVLGVPIVAAATLYAVQMILRESSEARKKVDFVSNVTHELKTPLTSIRMFIETLKLGRVKEPEQVNACLDVILQEANRLGILIDHVLTFSKLENQVKKYNMQPGDLGNVVRDTVQLFKAQMRATDGEIRLFVMPGLPANAEFDKDALREVVLNLLSNAIKYSGDDKFVTVRVGQDRNDLFIEVADRGIGIDPADHKRIFEKFYRVDEALTRRVDGTGLGLTISLEIAKAHSGDITLESARGKGSRFTVWLPIRLPKAALKTKTVERTSTRETMRPVEPAETGQGAKG